MKPIMKQLLKQIVTIARTCLSPLLFPLLLSLSLLLTACREQESQEKLKAWISQAKQRAAQTSSHSSSRSATLSAAIEPDPPPYLSAQIRSPFYRHQPDDEEAELAVLASRPPQRGPRQPLEDYPLDSITLVGTLLGAAGNNALIRTDGKVHRIRSGDYLGAHFGRVLRISANALELEELLPQTDGSWSAHLRHLHFASVTP
jgi:type IV pilus assembly protein PilP